MKNRRPNGRYGDDKVIDACAVFGVMNLSGESIAFRDPVRAMNCMQERTNGLGSGFAVYGIYPDYKDAYAFHIMYMDHHVKQPVENFLEKNFRVLLKEEIPTSEAEVWKPPLTWRYFVEPIPLRVRTKERSEEDYVLDRVMEINTSKIGSALVFSSGKNMGVFKGVGYPEDIAQYFCLDEYEGYMWICHGRYPTNTPGWWGGAHPFNILDWSVAHNGELSSYGVNWRFLKTYGYKCTMQTDTEVITYAFDLLVGRHGIPVEVVSKILAPPFWDEIDQMPENQRKLLVAFRQTYGDLLMNGPFSVITGRQGEMLCLTDRIKLRPLTVGINGDFMYMSSEEAAIRAVSPTLEKVWNPNGGEIVVGRIKASTVLEIQIASREMRKKL